ncbi:MAG: type I restriction enzyme endonuclease domain-containing protein [Fibrobacterota bacterium]
MQARSFAELLEQSLRRYQNRAIEAAQVIEELIGLAKQMRVRRTGAVRRWISPKTSSPSTTRWRPTTAP